MTTVQKFCSKTKLIAAGPRWWLIPLAIYLLSRVFTTLVTMAVYAKQPPNPFYQVPTWQSFVSMWDGFWYHRIATYGYPNGIPSDDQGNALQSEWAFFPVYPMSVRGIMLATGWDFATAGVVLNIVLGAVLAVIIFDLARTRLTANQAALATALVFVFPASPVFQYTYTETIALLLLVVSIRLLSARRYLWTLLPVLLLAFTRPIAVPFGLVVLIHLIYRFTRRKADPLSWVDSAKIVVLGLVTAATSVAFPLTVGVLNDELGVYNRIQAAWHGGNLGYVTPWWHASIRAAGPVVGPLLLVGLVLAWAAVLYYGRRIMGVDMTAWVFSYQLYLFVVLQPWTSVFRYWLLLFPLAILAAAAVRSLGHALTWLWSMLALQVVWVAWLWHISPPSDIPP